MRYQSIMASVSTKVLFISVSERGNIKSTKFANDFYKNTFLLVLVIVFSTLVMIQIVVVRTPPTLINPLLVKGNNFQKYYQFVFRMKTVILLLLSTMFGIGFGFVQELNFPDEDLEDSLYGTGDVLENNDAHKSNGKAMEKQCLAANLMNLWMLIKRNQ